MWYYGLANPLNYDIWISIYDAAAFIGIVLLLQIIISNTILQQKLVAEIISRS
jgi:hypothetical protein